MSRPVPPARTPAARTDSETLAALLKQTESYLSALHGSVARHDNLAANLGCAGCELRDSIRGVLAASSDPIARRANEASRRTAAIRDAEAHNVAVALGSKTTGDGASRLLSCGLCYEEQGEEVHPHPECLIGTAPSGSPGVVALYERWVKAGPPPLGTSIARWWDKRLAEPHAAVLPPEQDDEDQEQGAEPPVEAGPARLDQVQPAYDAVSVYIRGLGEYVPTDMVHRNAVIWRGVHAALGATPVGRCVSSHCVEGDHILPVKQSGSPS
ncbi:MAG: hypothetical protein HOY75_09615 [Streptomyces sp.]|nr:hypothetical protein [Streptomyces sp.]